MIVQMELHRLALREPARGRHPYRDRVGRLGYRELGLPLQLPEKLSARCARAGAGAGRLLANGSRSGSRLCQRSGRTGQLRGKRW